jgi:outer membrane receptor for ferrienterochelin and colicins
MRGWLKIFVAFCLGLVGSAGFSQCSLTGRVGDESGALPGATIKLSAGGKPVTTDSEGRFTFGNLPCEKVELTVTFVGYAPRTLPVDAASAESISIQLKADPLMLSQAVVTATRQERELSQSPVWTDVLGTREMAAGGAVCMSEGLSLAPGLRVENNCGNCGFTQVRMNGMDGAYSQMLINGRPVFSALAGVYGLDMLPAQMIERIEVVRGGGSVMYGGNAIAGTINVVTRLPLKSEAEVTTRGALMQGGATDMSSGFNASVVMPDANAGVVVYGFARERSPLDVDGDGFSDMPLMRNRTIGAEGFWRGDKGHLTRAGGYAISEFRRGGNGFHLPPHQAQLAEQLQHDIIGGHLTHDWQLPGRKATVSGWLSGQRVKRDSYYGSGGRVLPEGEAPTEDDLAAMNAYGRSEDFSFAPGIKLSTEPIDGLTFVTGVDLTHNALDDRMPGYGRQLRQRVSTWGGYLSAEWAVHRKITLTAGGRYDFLMAGSRFSWSDELQSPSEIRLPVFVPRVAALWKPTEDWQIRLSYSEGYRGPQAFDEDLHIDLVGGEPRFVRLSEDLMPETSRSGMASVLRQFQFGSWAATWMTEAFWTELLNPFVLSDPEELPSGAIALTKRNGSGAVVRGFHNEWKIGRKNDYLSAGITLQQAHYQSPETIWESEEDESRVVDILKLPRTPDVYGQMTARKSFGKSHGLLLSGVLTGPMDVLRIADIDTQRPGIIRTGWFWEQNLQWEYVRKTKDAGTFTFSAGVLNLFNAFQRDFDTGAERDASYIYGPLRPRTWVTGVGWRI